jgi:hypothetical protein
LSAKQKFGFNSAGDQLSYFNGDDELPSLHINHIGGAKVTVNSWGHKNKEWEVTLKAGDKNPVTYLINQLAPQTSYKFIVNGKVAKVLQSDANGTVSIVRNPMTSVEVMSLRRS